jgi:AAA domain
MQGLARDDRRTRSPTPTSGSNWSTNNTAWTSVTRGRSSDLVGRGHRGIPKRRTDQRPMHLVCPCQWRGELLSPTRWPATNRIPAGDVTILSDDGGGGKTTVALQLALTVEEDINDWLGTTIEADAVIFFSARSRAANHLLASTRERAHRLSGWVRIAMSCLPAPNRPSQAYSAWNPNDVTRRPPCSANSTPQNSGRYDEHQSRTAYAFPGLPPFALSVFK